MSDWISVDDRFPEAGEWYLVATYTDGEKSMITNMLFLDSIRGDDLLWLACDGDWSRDVTHWQHLPPPPEAE